MSISFSGTNGGIGTNTNTFSIDSTGRVLQPKRVMFHVRGNKGASTTAALVPFNIVDVNVGNGWNPTTYSFTCQIPGLYYFHLYGLTGVTGGSSAYGITYIRKNAVVQTVIHRNDNAAWTWESGSCSVVLSLSAGDVIDVFNGDGGFYLGDSYSGFNGFLLG